MFSFLQINQVHNNTFQFCNLLQVIDETLRLITFSLTVFREAKTDFSINGWLLKDLLPGGIGVKFYIL